MYGPQLYACHLHFDILDAMPQTCEMLGVITPKTVGNNVETSPSEEIDELFDG